MKTWLVPGAVRLGMMSFWINWANPPMIILPTWVRYTERDGYSKNIDGWSDRCPGDEKMCRSYKRNFDIPDIGVSRLLVLGPTSVTITRLIHAIVDVSAMCSKMKIRNCFHSVLIQCSGIRTVRSFHFLFRVEAFEMRELPGECYQSKKKVPSSTVIGVSYSWSGPCKRNSVLIQCSGIRTSGGLALCSELKFLKCVNCSERVTKIRKRSLPQHPLVIATLEPWAML